MQYTISNRMAIIPLSNESELLTQISTGNAKAFKDIFDHYHGYVYTFAKKITRSETEAEEIVQDIFLKIWFTRNSLPAINNFGAYLSRLVRNKALNQLRSESIRHKGKDEVLSDSAPYDLSTQQVLDYKEVRDILDQALAQLSEKQREIYLMCHEQGLKYDEVAALLQISSHTVHYHMKQALQLIRQHFNKHALIYPALLILFF